MGGAGCVVATAPRPTRGLPGGGPVTLGTRQPRDALGNALPCLTLRLPCLGILPPAARHIPERAVTPRSASVAASQRLIIDCRLSTFPPGGVAI